MRSSVLLLLLLGTATFVLGLPEGRAIYIEQCASCHGENGEGVAEEYEEPLWGDRNVESLARYIHKWMPEFEEEKCEDEDAEAVARYIHEAFYSAEARAKNHPVRRDLVRLTNRQYRHSVADLVGSFLWERALPEERGLKAVYSNAKKMNLRDKQIAERIDPGIDYDFGDRAPLEGMTQQGFSIVWSGSLLAPDDGEYEFRLRTQNGARLSLNQATGGGGMNALSGGDDGGPFIDMWVSSGNEIREESKRLHLLGGRLYPLHLQYFSYQEKSSSIRLEWKRPHGAWQSVPTEFLVPESTPPVLVIDTPFEPDDRSEGYERGTSISAAWSEAAAMSAVQVARALSSHFHTLAKYKEGEPDEKKLRDFATTFAERAFRRPLDDDERRFFVDSRFDEGADPEAATQQSLLLILNSPRFLFPDYAAAAGTEDDHVAAARLALHLWDSLPDQPLREAATRGELRTPEQLAHHARRLIAHPRARAKMRGFFHEWLGMNERLDFVAKDPDRFPGFTPAVIADLRSSLERFVEGVVWSDTSDYRRLLLAEDLYLSPLLADFYGVETPAPEGFAKVRLGEGERAGVLSHPYLLASFSYPQDTSPIHRGVFLSRNILGRMLKPPPKAIEFKDSDFNPEFTMREKVTELTKNESCMSCHSLINPVGFSLENFDAVGRWRTEDKRKPIDPTGIVRDDDGDPVPIGGVRDLATLASESEAAQKAFIAHLFHHLVKQPIDAYGHRTLPDLRTNFEQRDFHIRDLMTEIAVLSSLPENDRATARNQPHRHE